MPISYVEPKKIQESVNRGFDRMRNFRNARLMFLRSFVGQYYDQPKGLVGTEPLNLIFNAIRTLIPHVVMNFPAHKVRTRYAAYRDYAEMMGLELEQNDRQLDIRNVYRRVIVDAIFMLGVMQTGIAQSDSLVALDTGDTIDPGEVYTGVVDFDNFVADPRSEEYLFKDAAYLGHRLLVPRGRLLDSGLYKNDLVERLPRAGSATQDDRARSLSMRNSKPEEDYSLEDEVEVVELWVPDAQAIVTVPGTDEILFDDYLRVTDYYGPKEGPYTFLALSPPVPGNPMPVPPVGIWHDLHVLANRMAKKIVDQAERQKDVLGYKRSAADDAEEVRNAGDGDMVAMDDPDGVQTYSLGGQKNSNEVHLAQLQSWFNVMAGNPERLAGAGTNADTATAENNMQTNASVGLDDMKDLVYIAFAQEARKREWFFHTDPLRETPLSRRRVIPAQWAMGPVGAMMVQPAQVVEEQIILTPEARRGDFLDFVFEIEPESMGRKDSRTRFAQAIAFLTKVVPSVFTAAQSAAMMGVPFSPQACIINLAKQVGFEWIEEVFADPNFQMQVAMMLMAGPQPQGSKGQMAGAQAPGMMDQILQNGQPASVPAVPTPQMQDRQMAQEGANDSQRTLKEGY